MNIKLIATLIAGTVLTLSLATIAILETSALSENLLQIFTITGSSLIGVVTALNTRLKETFWIQVGKSIGGYGAGLVAMFLVFRFLL